MEKVEPDLIIPFKAVSGRDILVQIFDQEEERRARAVLADYGMLSLQKGIGFMSIRALFEAGESGIDKTQLEAEAKKYAVSDEHTTRRNLTRNINSINNFLAPALGYVPVEQRGENGKITSYRLYTCADGIPEEQIVKKANKLDIPPVELSTLEQRLAQWRNQMNRRGFNFADLPDTATALLRELWLEPGRPIEALMLQDRLQGLFSDNGIDNDSYRKLLEYLLREQSRLGLSGVFDVGRQHSGDSQDTFFLVWR